MTLTSRAERVGKASWNNPLCLPRLICFILDRQKESREVTLYALDFLPSRSPPTARPQSYRHDKVPVASSICHHETVSDEADGMKGG